MIGARGPQDVPLLPGHGGTISHRQRPDDGAAVPAREPFADRAGEPSAEPVEARGPVGTDVPVPGPRQHVAGGGDAADEEPSLVVHAAGIDQAPRPLEPYGELPALAGQHHGRAVVPAETQTPSQGDDPTIPSGRGNVEVEAYPVRIRPRQPGDGALHHQRRALQLRRQLRAQQTMGAQQGPQETAGDQGGDTGRWVKPRREHEERQERDVGGIRCPRQVREQQDAGCQQHNPRAHRRDPSLVWYRTSTPP
jgi:hypothetical protein